MLSAATDEGRLLLTLDREFGDVRRYPPGSHAGIVVIRPTDGSCDAVIVAVDQLVEHHDLNDLVGTVAVVHTGILRVRRPADSED